MTGSLFEEVNINGTTITEGDWSYVSMRYCHLEKFDLRKICFKESDLYGANLENADLRNADLTNVILSKSNIVGADFRGAKIDGIDFRNITIKKTRFDMVQTIFIVQSYGAIIG